MARGEHPVGARVHSESLPDVRAAAGPCRAVLIVAHPGHELRVHHWLRLSRPRVVVLTDGSGNGRPPRLASTARVLDDAGATPDLLFGRFTDRAIYQALLDHRFGLFIDLAEELADLLAGGRFECVAGDAAEGFNPTHDACRFLIDTAVKIAGRTAGVAPANFDFLLDGPPDSCPDHLRDTAVRLMLDDAQLERKVRAARSYPELAGEVDAALGAHGADLFRTECLRPVEPPAIGAPAHGARELTTSEALPFYEQFGAARVAAGAYGRLIRRREHLDPLAAALGRHADERISWPRCAS